MRVLCGTDATRVSRIARALERNGDRFLARVFTPAEIAYCDQAGEGRLASLAARFAAKEAVAKAMGTGIAAGVALTDIEIIRDNGGAPTARLHNRARARYDELGGVSLAISLSHEGDLAIAMCVLLCGDTGAAGATGATDAANATEAADATDAPIREAGHEPR